MSKHYTLSELNALEDGPNVLPSLIPVVSTQRDNHIVHKWTPVYGDNDPVWDILKNKDLEGLNTWEKLHSKEGRQFLYYVMQM